MRTGIKLTNDERGIISGNSLPLMCTTPADTSKSAAYHWFLTVDNSVDLNRERVNPRYPQGSTSTSPL
jgi:hypothetical protein